MNNYTPHSLEVRVRTSQSQMLAQAGRERLVGLAKANVITSNLPGWRRYLGQWLINLGRWLAGPVKPSAAQ